MKIYALRTEKLCSPIGIDIEKPAFSWKMYSDRQGAMQSAYRIVVQTENNITVWDSGKVLSDESLYIVYDGEALKSRTRYFWQVTVWDETDTSTSSDTAWFETGLMSSDESAWDGARWIGSPTETTNTSAVDCYSIHGTFRGEKLGLAINARNKDNYILIDIFDKCNVYEISDNAWNHGEPYKKLLGSFDIPAYATNEHEFHLTVNRRYISLIIDNQTIINNEEILPQNHPVQPRKSYMMSVGFNQSDSRAEISHLKIETDGMILQEDDFKNGTLSALGKYENGSLVIENIFELICPVPAVNLRKNFNTTKEIKSARLYASARGFYEAYINGKKVGCDFYNPGFTDYRYRIQYQTFDVTDMIVSGENTIGATVGKGHYSGFCGYSGSTIYGKENSFICRLAIAYTDGSCDVIVTDDTWQFTDKGAVVDSDYFDGEFYDARLEFDWCDYSDKRWKKCGIKNVPTEVIPNNGTLENVKFNLSAQCGPTAQITNVLKGKFIGENPKGHFIYDFGQNMVGTIRLKLNGQHGQSIKIRYGEMIYKEGDIYIQNLRSAANTDVYIMKGGNEEFVPSLTSHGFRYVEITGNGCEIEKDIIKDIEGLVIANINEVTGDFECSNPLINQLQSNIRWGQKGNYLLVPTDCPQRNERMGWTGDAQVFAATSAYNMDVKAFTDKWLIDLMDGQLMYNKHGAVPDTAPLGGDNRIAGCAGWGDSAVIVPWEMYKAYGDVRILENCYDMMEKWIAYQSRDDRQNYGLRTVDGVEAPDKSDLASVPYIQVQQTRGDHLTYDSSTPYIYSATAYAAHVADIMAQVAEILGKADDVKKYRKRFEDVKQAFNEAWVEDDGSIAYWGEMNTSTPHCGEAVSIDGSVTRYTYYSDKDGSEHHPSQTAYALAIAFGLIPEEKLAHTAECFRNTIIRNNGKLTVGFLGISHLAPALSKVGLDSDAFSLLEQEENPSWLYSVINGATTIWERWNSYIAETGEFGDIAMNSFNHYSYGAIGEWMFSDILGIKPLKAAYKEFTLAPKHGGHLTYAKGYHESPYGRIESAWELKDGRFIYECTIPANTTAKLYLPSSENTIELVSGKYKFEI